MIVIISAIKVIPKFFFIFSPPYKILFIKFIIILIYFHTSVNINCENSLYNNLSFNNDLEVKIMKNCGKYKDNLNVIGPTLRKIRTEKNISLETLSSKLLLLGVNIPITCLHRIENNQRTIRDYEICAIAVVLDIDVSELLNDFVEELKKN
jgi:hypothetical protein